MSEITNQQITDVAIALEERLELMKSLEGHSPEECRQLADETLDNNP